jgi:hypothetical protein
MVSAEKTEKNNVSKFSKKNIPPPVSDDLSSVGKKLTVISAGDVISNQSDVDGGKKFDNMDHSSGGNIQNEIEMKPEKIEKQIYKKKPPEIKEKVLDKATSDWLCDNCDAQNFAKLLSGNLRVKCFKCSTTRGKSCVLVLSVAEVILYVYIC